MRALESMPGDVRRVAVPAVIVSLVAGTSSTLLVLAAMQFRLDWFQDPARAVAGGPASAELLRWGAVLDLLGYYLATGVLAYALWRHLRPNSPTAADLSLMAALAYTLAGGVGAAVLATVGPMLITEYADAPSNAEVTKGLFAALWQGVGRGVWQLFDGIALGGWWIGLGVVLRGAHERLSVVTFVLGIVAIVGAAFNVLGLGLLRDAALGVVFMLWTAWWIWLLVLLLRGDAAPTAASGSG